MKRRVGCSFVVILLAAAVLVSLYWNVSQQPLPGHAPAAPESNPFDIRLTQPPGGPSIHISQSDQLIEKFCSTCHVLPPADCEPRHLWAEKIQEMYDYATSDRPWSGDDMPSIQEATRYWASRAPEQLELPAEITGSPPSPLPFRRHEIWLDGIDGPPAISNISFVRLTDDNPTQLLISDMRHGVVMLWTPARPEQPAKVIGRVPHPTRTFVVDLDGDGILDILVANIGVFWNVDTDQGSVVWLRGLGDEEFETHVLIDGISRVNDVKAADFDGDGDLDIVAAVFGNFTTGMVLYLENHTEDYSEPDFEPISLDGHTGTSDILLVDWNRDGRQDFLVLQSQQHEQVVAFLNIGRGRFQREVLYQAPHPRWGSTGIRLVDWNGNGELDVLINHGDAVQVPPVLRPYHGFGWLENRGETPLVYHRLAHLPGAHTAQPADLDGDGNLELVSSVFIPAWDSAWPSASELETVILLKRTQPGQYQRYVLETGWARHACMDLGDWDDDGDVDIVLGNFVLYERPEENDVPAIIVLENTVR
jgi:hypothetical protein